MIVTRSWVGRAIAIGELVEPHRTSYPEGSTISINPRTLDHFQFLDHPTDQELRLFHEGRADVRLLTESHTMLLLFRYGVQNNWQEAAFNLHRVQAVLVRDGCNAGEAECPAIPEPGHGWLVQSVMVEATDGRVVALRQYALSNGFSQVLHAAFQSQKLVAADDALHQRQVARFRRKQLAALAADAVHRFQQGDHKN